MMSSEISKALVIAAEGCLNPTKFIGAIGNFVRSTTITVDLPVRLFRDYLSALLSDGWEESPALTVSPLTNVERSTERFVTSASGEALVFDEEIGSYLHCEISNSTNLRSEDLLFYPPAAGSQDLT